MFKKFYFFIFSLLFLSACFYRKEALSLKTFPPIPVSNTWSNDKNDLTLAVHAFTPEESKNYFGVDLLSSGYIPLHFMIRNNGTKSYILRAHYIGLPLTPINKIASLIHEDTSLFVWGAGSPAFLLFWPATIWVATEGYSMYKNNQQISNILEQYSIDQESEELTIKPYDTIHKFMYIDRVSYLSQFSLKLYSEDDKRLLNFEVDIN